MSNHFLEDLVKISENSSSNINNYLAKIDCNYIVPAGD